MNVESTGGGKRGWIYSGQKCGLTGSHSPQTVRSSRPMRPRRQDLHLRRSTRTNFCSITRHSGSASGKQKAVEWGRIIVRHHHSPITIITSEEPVPSIVTGKVPVDRRNSSIYTKRKHKIQKEWSSGSSTTEAYSFTAVAYMLDSVGRRGVCYQHYQYHPAETDIGGLAGIAVASDASARGDATVGTILGNGKVRIRSDPGHFYIFPLRCSSHASGIRSIDTIDSIDSRRHG
nr:uncharacterized protein LOC115255667 [Aedes albopictus]